MTKINMSKEEFETALVEHFPKLYKNMNGDPQQTCMSFGVAIDNGWFDLIWKLSEKIEPLIDDENTYAEQVKSKFGTLRFYISMYDDGEIEKLVSEAEEKSFTTCEVCGEEGKQRTGGWIVTLCDKHWEERQEEMKKLREKYDG
jgi:hypothetical protein